MNCYAYLLALAKAERRRYENYHEPRKGEVYALWFHLMRMDNIVSALLAVKAKMKGTAFQIKPEMRVLDIGSGTGTGVMALTFVYARPVVQTPPTPMLEADAGVV